MANKKRVCWYFGNTDEIIAMEANVSYALIIAIIRRDFWLHEYDLCYLGVI